MNITASLAGTTAVTEKPLFVCLGFFAPREEGRASPCHCWPPLQPPNTPPFLSSRKAMKTFPYSLLVVSTDGR